MGSAAALVPPNGPFLRSSKRKRGTLPWPKTALSSAIESERRKISESYFNTAWLNYAVKS